ncbi:MAG: hypothetical protein DHS20C12_04190 [Pseudohongiella sp.]|nr:MAG: hypothetical protein DHS20C12_04190 [Pseudohongiella sp.]
MVALKRLPEAHLNLPNCKANPLAAGQGVYRFANHGKHVELKEIDRWQNKLCHANRAPMQFVH